MSRNDGRQPKEARQIKITTDYLLHPEGSCLIETGNTKVICTASIEKKVPGFLAGKEQGWITAEYSMLPRATNTRVRRERSKVGGRTQEIQRLIGRSLRTAFDLKALGEVAIQIDCDVIQADGGTRTASITGAYVACCLAIKHLAANNHEFKGNPILHQVAAISLGLVEGDILLDLDYSEDSNADVDMNVIMTSENGLIELQGTAEKKPFNREELNEMLDYCQEGLQNHFSCQSSAIGEMPNF